MGDLRHKQPGQDQDTLRARARERIEQGVLPHIKAARTWGGRGSGLPCNLCDAPISESEPEMELEFDNAPAAQSFRFHLQCHSIWDSERRAPEQNAWTAVEQSLPPFDAPVEARLNLGSGRTVIISIMRTKAHDEELTWLNATTHTPLPAAWLPVEWRYPHGLEPAEHLEQGSTSQRA
jgi:hypothetical protein